MQQGSPPGIREPEGVRGSPGHGHRLGYLPGQATAAAYVGSTGLLASLEAVQDNTELVGWMPPALAPFVLALVPAAIAFVSGWAARHTPRTDEDLARAARRHGQ